MRFVSSQKNIKLTFDSDIEVITPQLEKIQFTLIRIFADRNTIDHGDLIPGRLRRVSKLGDTGGSAAHGVETAIHVVHAADIQYTSRQGVAIKAIVNVGRCGEIQRGRHIGVIDIGQGRRNRYHRIIAHVVDKDTVAGWRLGGVGIVQID